MRAYGATEKKPYATPPAPQNRLRRAKFFMATKDEPHSKAELLKLAGAQHQSESLRPVKRIKHFLSNLIKIKEQ